MVTRHKLIAVSAAALVAALPILIHAFSGGPPAGRTGAPGELTCATLGCHAGSEPSRGAPEITLAMSGGGQYAAGETQQWTVRVDAFGAQVYGFQLSVRDASNGQAGMLSPVDATTQVVNSGPIEYIEHTLPRQNGQFAFEWTAPQALGGNLTVYVAANAANGNGQPTGDQILLRSFNVAPAAVPRPTPTLAEQNPVVNGASFEPGISPGSWVTIFGADLAPTTRQWDSETEIINGVLPTQLDDVSVTINGKPAAVFFISPTQINVQAPDDDVVGPVEVEVTRDGVTSAPANTMLARQAPAFFLFDPAGRKYVAAVHAELDDGQAVFVGPEGLFGDQVPSRPAVAGDVILLFGTGFGPTDPPVPAGQVFAGAASLVDPVTIRFDAVVAEDVQFSGLSGAGLYQFNVRVPDGLPEGDVSLTAEIGGVSTQDGVFVLSGR